MTTRKKRALIGAVASAVVLIAALAGYAYWTTTGAGSGSADAGTAGSLTLSASFTNGIYPGGTKTVTFTATNPNPGDVRVGTIHLASVGVDAGHAACVVADFTMPDVAQNVEIPTGATILSNTGTLSFADTGVSQDACKNATITLNLTSN